MLTKLYSHNIISMRLWRCIKFYVKLVLASICIIAIQMIKYNLCVKYLTLRIPNIFLISLPSESAFKNFCTIKCFQLQRLQSLKALLISSFIRKLYDLTPSKMVCQIIKFKVPSRWCRIFHKIKFDQKQHQEFFGSILWRFYARRTLFYSSKWSIIIQIGCHFTRIV